MPRRTRALLVALSTVLVLGSVVVVLCHFETWKNREISLSDSISIDIESGTSFRDIAKILADSELIENQLYFEVYARLNNFSDRLQAGLYTFSGSVSIDNVVSRLVTGDVYAFPVMLPEGGTFLEFKSILVNLPYLKNDIEHLQVSTVMDELGLSEHSDWVLKGHGEGWFFPAQYEYKAGDNASSILLKAHREMHSKLEEVWYTRIDSEHINSRYDLLKLASIIEKESALAEDRKRISRVFFNRLEKQMRLQADPTVIYGLGDAFAGNLTRTHLKTDNEYNTYTRRGLPPTPICSPSLISLEAAARPADGDEFYFVSRGDGTSEFSRTLAEHNRAVQKYQKLSRH